MSRHPLRPLVAGVVAVTLLAGCSGANGQEGPGGRDEAAPLTRLTHDDPLPEATLPVLGGGGALPTSELLGRPSVLNFWATWCPYCIGEMPGFEQVHQELGDRVAFVGIDREDPDTDRALALAAETGVTYPLVVDADGSFFQAVRGRGMPTTLFVDAEGVIRHRHAGPLEADELRRLIEQHLGVEA